MANRSPIPARSEADHFRGGYRNGARRSAPGVERVAAGAGGEASVVEPSSGRARRLRAGRAAGDLRAAMTKMGVVDTLHHRFQDRFQPDVLPQDLHERTVLLALSVVRAFVGAPTTMPSADFRAAMRSLRTRSVRGFRTRRGPPGGKTDRLHRTPAGLTTPALDGCGLRGRVPARAGGQDSYPVPVRRIAGLLRASFRLRLATDALALRRSFAAIGVGGGFALPGCWSCSADKTLMIGLMIGPTAPRRADRPAA